jgi:hypothetical protein
LINGGCWRIWFVRELTSALGALVEWLNVKIGNYLLETQCYVLELPDYSLGFIELAIVDACAYQVSLGSITFATPS